MYIQHSNIEIEKEQTEGQLFDLFDNLYSIDESDPCNILLVFEQLSNSGKFNESNCLVCGRKWKKRSPNGQTCGYCGYLRQKIKSKKWFLDTKKDITNELKIRNVEDDRKMILNHDHSVKILNGYQISCVCQMPGYDNIVAAEQKMNFQFNKHFCLKHNRIRVKCIDCDKLLVLYASDYLGALKDEDWKGPLCSQCSLQRHNYDPEFVKLRSEHLHSYNASEVGKSHNKKLLENNHKIIHNGWSKSEENRKILQKNCETYRSSEKGKKHMQEQAVINAESYRQSELFKQHCETFGLRMKYCQKCKKETYHNGQFCTVCHPESGGVSTSILWNVFDQNIPCNQNCKFLNSRLCEHVNDLKNDKGWCRWYINTQCGGSIPNFVEENGVLKYFNRKVGEYIPWESYKEHFESLNLYVDFLSDVQKYYPSAVMLPTFRTQDSVDWTGASGPFEQSLVEMMIKWFVYVKFYVDHDGNVKPIVAGKTGSKLVNINGTDLNFSMNQDDRPARRFLVENRYQWDKTKILIIPCENEGEAYGIEMNLQVMYGFFSAHNLNIAMVFFCII